MAREHPEKDLNRLSPPEVKDPNANDELPVFRRIVETP